MAEVFNMLFYVNLKNTDQLYYRWASLGIYGPLICIRFHSMHKSSHSYLIEHIYHARTLGM